MDGLGENGRKKKGEKNNALIVLVIGRGAGE